MLRYVLLLFLALPVFAAPGPEAAADIRCAALMSRVGDALEAAGHRTTLPTVRNMQDGLVRLAGTREVPADMGLMGELARTPPISLPASGDTLAQIEACVARLPG